MRTASIAASKHWDGVEAATTGTGLSPFRPNSTMSRSACSGFVGIPVEGPARWMSRIRSGSSSAIASPTVSALSTTPGPAEAVTPSDAAERRADRGADGGDLVLGLERDDAVLLASGELLQDRRGGRDRVRAEEERQPGELGRGDEAVRERGVPGDLPVRAGRERRRRDLVRDGEVLRRLPVVPPARNAFVFASTISGRFANFCSMNAIVPSTGRW